MKIGKAKIEERTHQLSSILKEGMKKNKKIRLVTPVDPNLSSGINCFDVEGVQPEVVVKNLLQKNILASTTPYKEVHARITPSIINTEDEVTYCLNALEEVSV